MTNIEDKAKYENETGQKLPDKILADCDMCKAERVFAYSYIQSGFGIGKDIPMYDCMSCPKTCRGTKSYNSLMTKFNGRSLEE